MRLATVAILVLTAACGGNVVPEPPPGEHCTPAEETACSCPDGTQSIRQCRSDGTWGPCQCVGE